MTAPGGLKRGVFSPQGCPGRVDGPARRALERSTLLGTGKPRFEPGDRLRLARFQFRLESPAKNWHAWIQLITKAGMPRLLINPNAPSAMEVQLRPGVNLLGRGFAND